MAVAVMAIIRTEATTNVWTGASGSDNFWETPANWTTGLAPGASDEARFFNQGAVSDSTITSTVTNNMTINKLWFGETNPPNQNLTINAGATLTITGTEDNGYGPLGSDPLAGDITPDPVPTRVESTIYVGTKSTNSSTQIVTATISGAGALLVSNLNNEINIRQFHPSGAAHRGVLNLSGLNTFTAYLGRIRVGDGEAQPENRSEGDLFLAATNNITLSGSNYQDNVQLVVGNNDVNQNQSNPSFLIFGGQNTLNLDQMLVGGKKQPGTMRGTNGPFASPTLKIRASDGVSRAGLLRIGDASDQPTSGNGTTGIAFLNDVTVDILADTIVVGKSQSTGTGAGSLSLGRLLVGPGNIDVNTLDVAFRMDNCASTTSAAEGFVDLSNTTMNVNSLLRLGRNVQGQRPQICSIALNGGSVTVRSNLIVQGAASITNINGLLAFTAPNALTVSNLVLNGGTISNASLISATNSLTISSNGAILGNTAYDMGNDPSKTWDVTGVNGGSLTSSNSFFGGGTLSGNLVQGNGGIIGAGEDGTVGTLTINGSLTLNNGALHVDLGSSAISGNDQINVNGTTTLNGTNDVDMTALAGTFDTANPYTLITSATLVGNQTQFRAAGPFSLSRFTFTFDTTTAPNTVRMIVGGAGSKNLTWVGDGAVNLWNAQGAANWNDGTGASTFFTLDNVSFTDSGSASPTVSLSGTLIPGTMQVNNVSKSYGFGGAGNLAASGAVTKSGTNSLTFTNGSGNSFSSLLSIQDGTVIFGNTGQNTFKSGITLSGTGAVVFTGNNSNTVSTSDGSTALTIAAGTSVTVLNAGVNLFPNPIQLDGTLTYNQSVTATLDGTITGAGSLIKNGSGTLTINGANSGLTAPVQINAGIVKAGSGTALGATGIVINNGGTLDIVGLDLGSIPVTVSGAGAGGVGAIESSGAPRNTGNAGTGLSSITLAGDATVGGSGPWDTDPVKNLGWWGINNGTLSTGTSNYNLTKVGLNQFGLSGGTSVDSALGNIDVQQGLLAFQGGVSSMGNPASNITIRAGATVSFFDTSTQWDKNFILLGDGATANLFNYDGNNTIIGRITLNGNCVSGAAPPARGSPISLALNGPIVGTGSLIKSGLDELILAGTNTYTGGTLVNAGKLTLDGQNISGAAVTNVSGTTIAGIGSNSGPVVVNGTLSPGDDLNTVGTLGTGPLILNGAKLAADLSSPNSDLVMANGNLTLNGTVNIQLNFVGTLTVGQNIPLIQWTGSLIGNTNQLQLLPYQPGYILNLYSNANTIGVRVAYVPLNKTWIGLAPSAPTAWDNVTTNWNNAGTLDVFNAGDIANFDDTGATNIVSLVGSLAFSAINLNNGATNYYFGGTGKLTGVGSLSLNGGGSLIITNSGSNDFTGGITVQGGGFLQVGAGGTNGTAGNGPITNSIAVVFDRTGTNIVNNTFFGTGAVTNLVGVLLLNADNSGAQMNLVAISSTLRPGTPTALGTNVGTTTITSGSTLDVNGQNLGAKSLTVSGAGIGNNGAIINSGAAQNSALQWIVLQGDTTFGGTARWDLRAGSVSTLDTGGQPFNITKIGTNQVSFVSITNVDAALSNIDIQQGTFSIQSNTGQMGDPTGTITVRSNAILDLFNLNLNPLNKNVAVTNFGTITNESGTSVIAGSVSIIGKATFGVSGTNLIISNANAFTASGTVTNITKLGGGSLVLVGNSLPGSTLYDINSGLLDLSQSTSPTLALSSGQTLRGNGIINGALQANAGSTVSPGENAVGVLTISNGITLGGTNIMEVSKTANTNDQLRAGSSSIVYGGTLTVSNLAGTFVGGENYKLYSAASYSGAFAVTNLPALSAGLVWITTNLTVNGTISVVSTAVNPTTNATITKVSLSGTNVLVHGTNNNVPNTSFHYVVLTSSNIATALSNWTPVATNGFSAGGTFDYTNPIVPGTPRQFIDVKAVP
jgi:autotransporter-associated beta strand protein